MDRYAAFDDFRWNRNVIAVRDEEGFQALRGLLGEYAPDILADLDRRAKSFAWAAHVIEINYGDPSFAMFEAKDSGEWGVSVTWTGADDYEGNVSYYGQEPIEASGL